MDLIFSMSIQFMSRLAELAYILYMLAEMAYLFALVSALLDEIASELVLIWDLFVWMESKFPWMSAIMF